MNPTLAFAPAVVRFFRDYTRVCATLCRVMIPIIVLVKIIQELGAVEYLAAPLGPAMRLIGLPPELGLAWASAMLGNLYTGMVVLQAMLGSIDQLTTAQVTVLAVLMLVAHNMVLECRITQSCGTSFWGQFGLRVGGGLLGAFILSRIFAAGGLLQEPAVFVWAPPASSGSLAGWAVGEVRNLGFVFVVILALMAFMRALDALKITGLLERVLSPFLKLMGIGNTAATITVIGMTMGLAYGGGLIIHEVSAGHIPKRDVFAAVSLMSLCHAVIEDTLLMALVGASAWGTLAFRVVFSIAAIAALVRLRYRGQAEAA